jgi:hypothetical protein
MTTIYLALKVSALLLTIILPFRRPRRKEYRNHIELSDLGVNEKGFLERLAQREGSHPIKIKH